MKKILSIMLTLCLCINFSFAAFDPYADEEVEKKSNKKLYYGIVLTLLGGFLAYDGFSMEEVDVSKPSVDYVTVSHSEWVQDTNIVDGKNQNVYHLRSGYTDNSTIQEEGQDYTKYEINKKIYTVEKNIIYNNGNVDLKDVAIEVRYKFSNGTYIGDHEGNHLDKDGRYYDEKTKSYKYVKNQGYHCAEEADYKNYSKTKKIDLKKGESVTWLDVWDYTTTSTDAPNDKVRIPYYNPNKIVTDPDVNTTTATTGTAGLNLGKDSSILVDIRVKLNKNQQYKPIYEKRHKSDIEGVAGILVGITGIYFIVDHFLDMHKFNAYAKRHSLNLKVSTASNEYKLMLQKRL